ncbi:hypothetical protein BaRGS_00036246 [Batillaria attramentaria]|uniref:Secreted protein n=1 Tax=Batillaria attramentaria TaxID=370345 RepID=A0ABD0JC76_9CAEN
MMQCILNRSAYLSICVLVSKLSVAQCGGFSATFRHESHGVDSTSTDISPAASEFPQNQYSVRCVTHANFQNIALFSLCTHVSYSIDQNRVLYACCQTKCSLGPT